MAIEFIKKAIKNKKTEEKNISKIVTQMLSEIEIGGEEKVREFTETFDKYKKLALGKGFSLVSSSPLTRSSFHADSDFQKLRKIRVGS